MCIMITSVIASVIMSLCFAVFASETSMLLIKYCRHAHSKLITLFNLLIPQNTITIVKKFWIRRLESHTLVSIPSSPTIFLFLVYAHLKELMCCLCMHAVVRSANKLIMHDQEWHIMISYFYLIHIGLL